MIGYFPKGENDELLSSILARFVRVRGLTNYKEALEILFGAKKVNFSPLFQGHIQDLLYNVNHIWRKKKKDVIEHHSIFPLFKPFILTEDYQFIIDNLINGNPKRIPGKIGRLGSSVN